MSSAIILAASLVALSPQAPPPAPPPSAAAQAAALRNQVRTMEGVLVTAVQNGVGQVAKQISEIFPEVTIFAGTPRAHGYQVEGYGWFFDVEVPQARPAVLDLYVELARPLPPSAGNLPVGNTSVRPVVPQSGADPAK